jgi:hypothetical protein
MKVFLSIPLIMLLSFSGISVKFAAHYCGGMIVANKFSVSAEFASCGMEKQKSNNTSEATIKTYCCDNVIFEYSINNIYVASFQDGDLNGQIIHNHEFVSQVYFSVKEYFLIQLANDINPPGTGYSNSEILPALCTFRI